MKPKIKKLANGLRIATVEMPDNPTVTVMVMVAAGTRYETPAQQGLSHFLEHMCFQGTVRRTNREIAYELESIGAESNAFTSYDYTGYWAKGRADKFPKLLDIVSDIYLHSTFPESAIKKEQGVVMGEIDMSEDMPKSRVGYLFLESLYGKQPAGMTILGTKETVSSFTRNDLITYHNAHYVAEKTIVVVAGNITSAAATRMVQQSFGGIKRSKIVRKKKITAETGNRFMHGAKPTDQAHIVIGTRGAPAGTRDEAPLAIAAGVLGQGSSSRLFLKLREEMGAGYYVYASHAASDDAGEFDVVTGTAPARVGEVARAIRAELDMMATTLVPIAELRKTQEYLIGSMMMGLESSDAVAYLVARRELFGQRLTSLRDLERRIRAVTPADVLRVAKKYFKHARIHTAMVGPAGSGAELPDIFAAE